MTSSQDKMPSKRTLGGLFVALLLLVLYIAGALDGIDLRMQDRLYQRPGLIDPRIFVVGIDEKSLGELGPFQTWPRDTMAKAIEALNKDPAHRPVVIAIDVLYAEHSESEMDDALVHATSGSGNVALASVAYFGDRTVKSDDGYVRFREALRLDKPFPELEAMTEFGLINATADDDHVLRRSYLYLPVLGEDLPTLPARICGMFLGTVPDVPLDRQGQFLIPFTGMPGEYYRLERGGLSFSDLLQPDFDPGQFAGSIVLIGPYAPGMMDGYATPMDARTQMYGVEIMANTVQALLDGNFKREVPTAIQALAVLGLLLLLTTTFGKLDLRVSLAVLCAFCGISLFLSIRLFESGLIVSVLFPPAAAAALYFYHVIAGYVAERMEKQRVKSIFKKYVDPALVDSLVASRSFADEQGGRRTISVLFVDIRGFTPLSEKLKDQPETVVGILNSYFEMVCDAIFKNGGNIDKFIGDAAMALFNGFTPLDDHIYSAAAAAIDIVNGAESVFASVSEEYGVELRFGVGVHVGEAVVGNIGSSFRKDFTAIGDTVNTAARLESNAKASQVLVSKEVHDALIGRVTAVSLGEMTMKGKTGFQVYQLTGLT